MATKPGDAAAALQAGLLAQDLEMAASRDRQLRSVLRRTASGTGDIDATFGLDRKFRMVFVRCHFSGGSGTAPLVISVDSGQGASFDARLFTVSLAGAGRDVHLRITGDDLLDPSPWTFQADDRVRIAWTNPDPGNLTWGLEVGLALAA